MAKSVLAYALIVVMGAVVAVVGASAHRAFPWWGLTLSIAMVVAGAVFARAWKLWAGLATFALVWLMLTSVFAQEGPGGSLLVAGDHLGLSWAVGGAVAMVVAALLPRTLLMGSDDVAS